MMHRRGKMTDLELAGEAIEAVVARRRPAHSGHWRRIAPTRPAPEGWGESDAAWLGLGREMVAAFNRRAGPPAVHFGDEALLDLGSKPLVLFQLRLAAAREAPGLSPRMAARRLPSRAASAYRR